MKVRRGQLRLVIPGAGTPAARRERDEKLVALVAEPHGARQLLMEKPGDSIATIALAAKRCRTRLTRLLNIPFLAPDIVVAIVEGRQPFTLTSRSLMGLDLPLACPEQRALLGFS